MKCVPKTMTQPADWWDAFERQAQREGLTLSEWVGECCKSYVQGELSERRPANRPKIENQ